VTVRRAVADDASAIGAVFDAAVADGWGPVNVIADNALPYFRVNAVAPGFTATALNDFTGHQTVEQGAEVIVHAATLSQDGPTGSFFDKHGPIAW